MLGHMLKTSVVSSTAVSISQNHLETGAHPEFLLQYLGDFAHLASSLGCTWADREEAGRTLQEPLLLSWLLWGNLLAYPTASI